MKKIIAFMMILTALLALAGCGENKTLRCDHCGTDVQVAADSEMNDDWIIYCDDCNVKFGFDTLVSKE